MVTAYDSTTAADIPASAQMVLGYINGGWWSANDWTLHPGAHQESISVTPFANAGDWLDVETGDAFPWQAPGWVVMRRQAGHPNPGVYVEYSKWAATANEFHLRGIPEPRWWIALWDGIAQLPPGAFGKQYSHPPGSGGHYDLSVFDYTFGAGGGTIEEVVTQAEFDALVAGNPQLGSLGYGARLGFAIGMSYHAGHPELETSKLLTGVEALGTAVAALKLTGGSIDLSAVSNAVAAVSAALAAVAADVATIKMRIEKDLAP